MGTWVLEGMVLGWVCSPGAWMGMWMLGGHATLPAADAGGLELELCGRLPTLWGIWGHAHALRLNINTGACGWACGCQGPYHWAAHARMGA